MYSANRHFEGEMGDPRSWPRISTVVGFTAGIWSEAGAVGRHGHGAVLVEDGVVVVGGEGPHLFEELFPGGCGFAFSVLSAVILRWVSIDTPVASAAR